jgi:HEAT repeat protein
MRILLTCLLIAPALAVVGPVSARTNPAEMANAATTTERAHLILEDALKSRNPDTRKVAVQALGLIGPREPYLSELRTMLLDDDVQVRVAVVASVLDLKDKDTVSTLREAMSDRVPEVSFAAARALASLGDAKGRDVLIAVLAGERQASTGYFTAEGRGALRMFYTPRAALPYLLGRGIGFAHVAGLGLGVASLEGLLSDPDISGRAAAALLLSTDQDPRVMLALRTALTDKDDSVRAAAVHAIALRDDPALEADLRPFLDDGAAAVRTRAAAACLRLELIPPQVPAAPAVPEKPKPQSRRH